MTTPTDAIAGLSERLKDRLGPSRTVTVGPGLYEDVSGAATAIDALQARVKELEARSYELEARAVSLFWLIPDEVAYKVKCVDLQKRAAELLASESRALRAEQERDEAYERAAKVVESGDIPVTYGVNAVRAEIASRIRRLSAGPEKEGK